MNNQAPELNCIIWATRGKHWGFRFLLDGDLADPLATYEKAFAQVPETPTAIRRDDETVAARFPDPLGRRDDAGRVIPHEFVVRGRSAAAIVSASTAEGVLWPLVSPIFDRFWQSKTPPSKSDIRPSD